MIQQVVVNGCSYMESYASGNGHVDLATQLKIPTAQSLAIGGSANSRIIRTTIKHSYTAPPTLYILGMTFVSRNELPILDDQDEFEGRWTNPQNQHFKNRWQLPWTPKDTEKYVELKLKSEVFSILDRTEDLMYKILSTINDLKSRGHCVLVYQQADNLYQDYLTHPKLALFASTPAIIQGYRWRAIAWQHEQKVPATTYPTGAPYVPPDMVHPMPGYHQTLNNYLTNYIQEHKILV